MGKIAIVIGAIGLGFIALLGLYFLLRGARNVQLALASTAWPKTSGVVVRSETTRDVSPATRDSRSSVTFDPKTVIQYNVNGREYTTDILHFGQTLGSSDKSEAALQNLRFPKGTAVAVSYNPRDPSTAVMKPGLHAAAFWLPGAGLAFLIPVAMCLIMGPSIVSSSAALDDDSFGKSVQSAMDQASRTGKMPDVPMPTNRGGDRAMAAVAALFGAVFCGLGVLALTAGLQRMWHGAASRNWPTTQGEVIYAAAGEDNDTSDTGYYARFVYAYEVDGTKHFNNTRRFAQAEGGDNEEAGAIASRYHKGAKVRVSYFPTDPDVAVLEPGNTGASYWLPGFGLAAVLFSLAVLIFIVPAVAKPF